MEKKIEPYYRRYTPFEMIFLGISLLRTKLLFRNARLIRFPFDVRGKRHIKISQGFTTGKGCRIEAYTNDPDAAVLFIGKDVQINDYVHITAMNSIKIGNNVLLAGKIYISDCSHGSYKGDDSDSNPEEFPIKRKYYTAPVVIEDNVWIGEFVSILPGVRIGKGSIIGTMSVVSKNIPPFCIAVGSPARVIKKFNFATKHWEKA